MNPKIENEYIDACETHSDALFRYCYFKVSDRDISKDLVQETYMKTWEYLARGEKIDNIRAFFYKILNNLIIDHYRKKKSVSLDMLSEENHFEQASSHDEVRSMEDKIDGEKALMLLYKIPELYKDVIVLRFVEDLSIKEIADIRGESENSIAVKIHRGLKKIKEVLKEKNYE